MSEVGRKVKKLRMKKNISQNRLAKMAGISQPALSAIESGATNPSSITVELLANALECTVAELLSDDKSDDAITPAERRLILIYRTLNSQGREYIRQQMDIAQRLYTGESASLPNVENR